MPEAVYLPNDSQIACPVEYADADDRPEDNHS
jgi:hypothetical protein